MCDIMYLAHRKCSQRLSQKLAAEKAVCDYALYLGASVDNATSLPKLAGEAAALKMYLNDTYTTLK